MQEQKSNTLTKEDAAEIENVVEEELYKHQPTLKDSFVKNYNEFSKKVEIFIASPPLRLATEIVTAAYSSLNSCCFLLALPKLCET